MADRHGNERCLIRVETVLMTALGPVQPLALLLPVWGSRVPSALDRGLV